MVLLGWFSCWKLEFGGRLPLYLSCQIFYSGLLPASPCVVIVRLSQVLRWIYSISSRSTLVALQADFELSLLVSLGPEHNLHKYLNIQPLVLVTAEAQLGRRGAIS
jgi:hypothetical protein